MTERIPVKIEVDDSGNGDFIDYVNEEYQFSFQYPKKWILKEERIDTSLYGHYLSSGKGYSIQFYGPPESTTKIGISMLSVLIFPHKDAGGVFNSLDEMVSRQLLDSSFQNTTILEEKPEHLGGYPARETLVSYDTYRPPNSLKPTLIKSCNIWITTLHGNHFFTIRFFSSRQDFGTYKNLYERAKRTFTFFD